MLWRMQYYLPRQIIFQIPHSQNGKKAEKQEVINIKPGSLLIADDLFIFETD